VVSLHLLFGAVAATYALGAGLLAIRLPLHPRVRSVLWGFAGIAILLAGLYVFDVLAAVPFWRWFLDPVDGEKNAVAAFASLQLLGIGVVALYCGLRLATTRRVRVYWLFVAALFGFMSADEYFMLHEGFYNWEHIYAGVGLLLAAASAFIFRVDLPCRHAVFWLIAAGLALIAVGGILIEDVIVKYSCFYWVQPFEQCFRLQVLEEFFEIAGGTLVFVGVLEFARQGSEPARFRVLMRRVWLVLAVWLAVLVGNFWLQPALEARLLAREVDVQYLNGDLELIGYRVSSRPVISGTSSWQATLYWRANALLQAEYGVSLHFVTYPEVASITQNDLLLLNPSPLDWLPGQIIKQTIDLAIPPALEAPRNYWLTVTIWQSPWYDHNYIPIAETDQRLLTPEIVILEDFPFQ